MILLSPYALHLLGVRLCSGALESGTRGRSRPSDTHHFTSLSRIENPAKCACEIDGNADTRKVQKRARPTPSCYHLFAGLSFNPADRSELKSGSGGRIISYTIGSLGSPVMLMYPRKRMDYEAHQIVLEDPTGCWERG